MPSIGISLNSEQKAEVKRLIIEGFTNKKIEELTGISSRTALNYRNKLKEEAIKSKNNREEYPDKDNEKPAKNDEKVDEKETDKERWERIRALEIQRKMLKEIDTELSFRSFITDLIREQVAAWDSSPPPINHFTPDPKAHDRHPILHLSDWHYGENVKSEAVMGMNEYNSKVASKRVWRIVQAHLETRRDMVSTGRYCMDTLHVAANGDMITGTLHGLERQSDNTNVIHSVLQCARILACAIRDLAAEYRQVYVHCTVGNHGRLPDDKKVDTKDPTRSFDFMVYTTAAIILANQKNVKFEIPECFGCIYNVGGWNVFSGHGHFLKAQLSIIGYGMRTFSSNLAANMSAAGKPIHYCLFGHFHHANSAEFAGVTAFINPSLIGTQEYGLWGRGGVNRSAQNAHLLDSKLGITETHTIYGEGPGYDGSYDQYQKEWTS